MESVRNTNSTTTSTVGDRFIPARSALDLENSHHNIMMVNDALKSESSDYQSSLSDCVFQSSGESKILAFKPKPPVARSSTVPGPHRVLYSQNMSSSSKMSSVNKKIRHLPQSCERVLDAPGLVDDYYLNLLDWSSQNILAVALSNCVYLWNGSSGETEPLVELEEDDLVTSVSWVADGSYLAVGTNNCEIQLWDVEQARPLRKMRGHAARVGSLAWNQHILSSGSKDASIIHHDVRIASHIAARLCGHQQEVCGLQWSADGSQLASGGNDNILNIWDGFSSTPKFSLGGHQAAVKAVAWCPWQRDLLATGGGTADRCLKLWNSSSGVCVESVDTQSQVCAIQWSQHFKGELVSSHGYSQNQLSMWKMNSIPNGSSSCLSKMTDLCGHSARVLHMAKSPDGETIVSAGADETLRFWKVWENDKNLISSVNKPKNLSMRMNIR